MKHNAIIFCLASISLMAAPSREITDFEADAIVAAEVAADEAKRQAEIRRLHVLQKRFVNLGDRTLTLERVATPNLPNREEAKPTPRSLTSVEELAMLEQFERTKWIHLSATVYDNYGVAVTHFRWQHEDELYEAWAEADFNYLRTAPDFTVDGQKYHLSLFVFNESVEKMHERRKAALAESVTLATPEIPTFPTTKRGVTEYFVIGQDRGVFENESAFTPIDDLLRFYDSELETLKVKLANQEALNAARKRHRKANPESKDKTLTYWIEEK